MSITFTDAPVPTVTRTSEPNPFMPLAEVLAGNVRFVANGEAEPTAKKFEIPLPTDSAEAQDATIAKVKRQLSLAGREVGITIRSTVETGGSKAKPVAIFTAWGTPAVKRPRKSAEAGE